MIECDYLKCNEPAARVFHMTMPGSTKRLSCAASRLLASFEVGLTRFSDGIVCIRCLKHPVKSFEYLGHEFKVTEYDVERGLELFGKRMVEEVHES